MNSLAQVRLGETGNSIVPPIGATTANPKKELCRCKIMDAQQLARDLAREKRPITYLVSLILTGYVLIGAVKIVKMLCEVKSKVMQGLMFEGAMEGIIVGAVKIATTDDESHPSNPEQTSLQKRTAKIVGCVAAILHSLHVVTYLTKKHIENERLRSVVCDFSRDSLFAALEILTVGICAAFLSMPFIELKDRMYPLPSVSETSDEANAPKGRTLFSLRNRLSTIPMSGKKGLCRCKLIEAFEFKRAQYIRIAKKIGTTAAALSIPLVIASLASQTYTNYLLRRAR